MENYKFLKDEKISGKTIVIRVDLNSNVEDGELFENARLRKYAKSLKELSEKNTKLVVLAHQGRKGDEDCVSLKPHAEELSERTGKEIKVLPWDSDYVTTIKEMQAGDIVLMENVRFHENEEQNISAENASKIEWIQKIASVCQIFVQDALSVCHRSQPSVIGFTPLLPSFIGPVLEAELEALKHFDSGEKPCVFVLGGSKIKDSLYLINELFGKQKADKICAGGLLGELFLKAKGVVLGEKDKFFEEKGFNKLVEPAKQVLENYGEQIILPLDVAIMNDSDEREEISISELPKENSILDIGTETVAEFKESLKGAKLIVANGPMGVFERMDFEIGTKRVFNAISKARGFSIIGGGDTETALEQVDFSEKDFSHISLAGKALLQYLSGKEMPGLVTLQGKSSESKPEQPAVEEPKIEESKVEEPAVKEASAEEETAETEEPAAEEHADKEPAAEEPVAEEPAAEEHADKEPVAEEPTAEEPESEKPEFPTQN